MSHLIIVLVHIFIVDIIGLSFWSISSDTSDNRLLDFTPLASDIGWFVVVASACCALGWVWSHFENFSIFWIFPVLAIEVVLDLSWIVSCFGPLEELVCDIVLIFKSIALIFFSTKLVNILNFSWLPLWNTTFCFTLDWSNRESILCSVIAFQVTSPLLLNWTIVGCAFV
jgi:hypothetical protein